MKNDKARAKEELAPIKWTLRGEVLRVVYGQNGALATVTEYHKDLGTKTKTETEINTLMESTMSNEQARELSQAFNRYINRDCPAGPLAPRQRRGRNHSVAKRTAI